MTWRIALSSLRFQPVDANLDDLVLNKITGSNEEIESLTRAEQQRLAEEELGVDEHAHIHMISVPNEGMMAGQPTNCYLIGPVAGDGPLTLIDAGRSEGLEVFTGAFEADDIDPTRIERIVLTHCHPDHVGGAEQLRELSGAPIYAPPGEREHIERFTPGLEIDQWLDHDAPLVCEGYELRPIYTPGHSPGHIAFVESQTRMLLAGDMISGFGSVGIFPPNGSVGDYIDSLRRLLAAHEADPFIAILPGHGPVVPGVREKIEEYIAHRLQRENEIITALQEQGPLTTDELMPIIYVEILPHLAPAGKATITMHLQKLLDEGRVIQDDETYRLV